VPIYELLTLPGMGEMEDWTAERNVHENVVLPIICGGSGEKIEGWMGGCSWARPPGYCGRPSER